VQRLVPTTTSPIYRWPLPLTLGLLVAALPGTQARSGPPAVPVPAALAPGPQAAAGPTITPANPQPTAACLANLLCELKDEVRWRTPRWDRPTCARIADAVLTSARQYKLSPALLMAVMLNESDLDEKASIRYLRDGEVYAKDGGLMGIRCVFDDDGSNRCANGHVRGLPFRTLMDPTRNVELGARQLAYFRDQGGVEKKRVRVRGEDGKLVTKTKLLRCRHRDHAWWAHYNHGNFYIKRGYARHYPQRIGVLYAALSRALALPAPELQRIGTRLTVHDPGRRPRTADRPVEPRFRVLCRKIGSVGGACRTDMTAMAGEPATTTTK
jgi:hypothetical protein